MLCVCLLFTSSLFAQQQVDFTLKYNAVTSEYEVYGKPTLTGLFSTGGGSQLTVMTPASLADAPITITSVEGGPWADNTQMYAPSAQTSTDFHSITTNGTAPNISFVAGVEKLIYKFTLPGGCVAGIRLFRNVAEGALPADPDSNVPGMAGNDFQNYFAPVQTGNQEYRANYANTGSSCAPATAPDLITTIGQPATPFVAGSPSNVPVTITNIGTAPDAGVITTTITLPAGFSTPSSFSPVAGTTCATSGQVVTCTTAGPLSNVAPSNTATFNVPITPAASTVGTKPTTTASVSSPNEPVANQTNNTAVPMTPNTAVAPNTAPDVVTTIGQPAPALVVGQTSNLPVTVTNQGTAPATGPITTTITLPVGVTTLPVFVSNGFTCSTAGQLVTCFTAGPLSNIAPNNAITIQVPITPDATIVGTSPVFNATTAVPNEPAATLPNNTSTPTSTTSPVAAAPAPNIVVTVGQPATPFVAGSPSSVPVTISNIGNLSDAGAFTSTITLPAGFSTTPGIFSPVAGTTCSTVGQVVTCTTAGPLSSVVGSNTKAFNLPITPAASTVGTTPTTNVSVSSPNEPAANQTNNTGSMWPTTPVAAAPAPDLVTTIGQPLTPFVAGSPSNVPVTIKNQGTAPDAGPITTNITLPTGFSTPATFSPVAGTTCSTSGQNVTCTTAGPLSNVAPNNTTTFNLPITPAASTVGTTPPTTGTTSSPNEPATSTGNNPATPMQPTTPVAAAPAPDLVTTIGQPLTPFVAGSPSNVPVTIKNQGTAPDAGPITTNITLPAGFSTPAVFSPVAGTTCSTSGQNVTCTTAGPLSNVAPNNTTTFNLPITPAASTVGTTPTTNVAVSSPNEPAANATNNTGSMTPTTPVAAAPAPDLVTYIGQPATPFVAGTPSNVPVTVVNQGTAPATGPVTATITLPVGFSAPALFTSNGSTCTTTGQVVSCSNPNPLSNIAPGNSLTVQVPVTPAASTVGTSPQTTATSSAPNEPATSTTNNPATPMIPTTPVTAAPAPDLVTTIGQPLTPFVAGTPSIVPVTIANIGTAPATGPINTTITLPVGMSAPAIFSPVAGTTCTTTGQTVLCVTTGPLSQTAPSNTIVINVPVTPAASTVGTYPSPFTAIPTAPNEPATNTPNNAATPMTPTTPVAAAAIVSVKLNVKLFLQGAYDQTTGLMRDDLRSRGFLPTAQPYTAMARTSYHTGTETTTAAVLAATGSNAIVDWVLLELRTGTGVATRVATRAALVQRDGDVVDMDGVSPVTFSNRAATSYYVVATHRNHLGVMSEVAVALSATANICDFTGAYDGFGSNAMKAIGNLNALWAGNSNHTGITHRSLIFSGANNDPDAVKNDVLTAGGNSAQDFSFVPTGYKLGDTNLDGDVKYQGPKNDVDAMIFFNVLSHPANTATSPLYLVVEQH
jgi:hypothetical protein